MKLACVLKGHVWTEWIKTVPNKWVWIDQFYLVQGIQGQRRCTACGKTQYDLPPSFVEEVWETSESRR